MDTLGRTRVPKTGEIAPTLDREDRYSGAVGPTSLQSAVRQQIAEGKDMARNLSPWFSLGYLLAIAVIVLLLVLFVLWLA